MKYDESSGMRGLKQIWKSLCARIKDEWVRDLLFEKHSKHFLNRCFMGWLKK